MTLGARKTRLADSARAAIHPPTPSGRKSRQPTAAASCSLWARQGESSQPLFLATATTRTWPGSHCYDQDQDQDDDNETTLCFLLAPPATFCASVWKAISGRALFSLSLSLSLFLSFFGAFLLIFLRRLLRALPFLFFFAVPSFCTSPTVTVGQDLLDSSSSTSFTPFRAGCVLSSASPIMISSMSPLSLICRFRSPEPCLFLPLRFPSYRVLCGCLETIIMSH